MRLRGRRRGRERRDKAPDNDSGISPGDRERVKFIVGHPDDPETFLHPADWYLPMVPWSHAMVAPGPDRAGTWWITAAQPGTDRFEVRRWPREAGVPITGVPKFDEQAVTFELKLDQADYEVKTELLDADHKVPGGGYYVYCRREGA